MAGIETDYAARYSLMLDSELQTLQADSKDLTEPARAALARELVRRGVEVKVVVDTARSEMSAKSAPARLGWLWPDVSTQKGAEFGATQAFWAAIGVAVITTSFAVFAIFGSEIARSLGMDAYALVDAAIFAVIAVGIWRRSRVAAWAGLLFYVAERIYMWMTIGVRSPIVATVFVLAFVGGVRGTMALHRFKTHGSQN
jgi:hypothetical protein